MTAQGFDWLSLSLNKRLLYEPRFIGKAHLLEMPFGKHAGTLLADLPGNYLAWFAREDFPESELGQLLELMHTIDHNDLRGLLDPIKQTQAKRWG